MWRFILISFAFLAFAFYELSGGADYEPSEDSLQVAMRDQPIFAPIPETPPQVQVAEADAPAPVETDELPRPGEKAEPAKSADRSVASRSEFDKDAHDGFEISLASAAQPLSGGQAMEPRPIERIGLFSAETLVKDVQDIPIDQALVTASQPPDIRQVKGDRANMRSGPGTDFAPVTQLSLGAEVEILDRRGAWVELREIETGRIGWMADWLVTATN